MLALLVIDVQQGMFGTPRNGEAVVQKIAKLIGRARAAGVPVFFVQHDGGPGDDLDRNGPGFAFRSELAPLADENVTVKKHCSAFHETDLDLRLRASGINKLVVCGMQTEFCVDTTVRAASERGFQITIPSDAHTTFDGKVLSAEQIVAQAELVWHGRFATVVKRADDVKFA